MPSSQAIKETRDGSAVFEKNVTALGGQFASAYQDLQKALENATTHVTAGAVILNEAILAFCLKKILVDDSTPVGEKQKRKALVVNQMGKIRSNDFGIKETMLHPRIVFEADRVMSMTLA